MGQDLSKYLSKRDMGKLLDLSYASLNCTKEEEFILNAKDLGELIQIDTILYTIGNIKTLYKDYPSVEVVDISCPDGYVDFYSKQKYYKNDAAIWEFLSTLEPVNWMEIECDQCLNYPVSVSAPDFGMNDGWTHGVLDIATMQCSLFFLGSSKRCEGIREKKILSYIIPFYTEAYKRVKELQPVRDSVLTPREKEVLHWIKEGKGSWEISMILKCSKRVIDFHVTNMKRKLNVTNRPQLVATALSQRLIDF